jgi:hypothetical protein
VVAMTTMFAFVYSQGGRALETAVVYRSEPAPAPAHAAAAAALAPAAPAASSPATARAPLTAVELSANPATPLLLAREQTQCEGASGPLAPASLPAADPVRGGSEVEIRALHGTSSGARGLTEPTLGGGSPCE